MSDLQIPLEDNFSDILRKAMRGTGVESAKLAGATGIARESIERWLKDDGTADDAQARAIAKVLRLDGGKLADSAFFLRTLEHLVRLVTGRARKWLPVAEHPRRAVQKLLWRVLQADDSFDPEMRLAEVMQQTRQVYLGNQWS